MNHEEDNSPWGQKGATLSDKTAQKEFNLELAEILFCYQIRKIAISAQYFIWKSLF
jgi:hypothetical protein